jgi:hypothetical protein
MERQYLVATSSKNFERKENSVFREQQRTKSVSIRKMNEKIYIDSTVETT